jgi:dTDP-glucose 4,6-dehydratase
MNFEDRYGIECMRLRFFNAYGPGEDYHPYRSVVALFCGAVLRDQNITVYKDYHRAFMYIEDFIPTLARVCGNNFMPGTAVNIGGVDYRSVEELADIVLAEVGKYQKYRGSVVVVPQDRHNVKSKRPNIERARRWFGHDPQVKLEVGVRETVDWMVGTRL